MKKILFIIAALTLSAGLWAETQTVSYRYPVYNTPDDPKSGIKEWKEGSVEATVITNASATLNAGWYVVLGGDVETRNLSCSGDVHLILADNSFLAAADGNETPGIQVSGEGNSLTIYGQKNQTGRLMTHGRGNSAGIGGKDRKEGSNITINGGVVEAQCHGFAAGIGGGKEGNGYNITINGGEVTAMGGIGGGKEGNGYNITINGGEVNAIGGIGGGEKGESHDIFVASSVLLKAGVLYAEIEIPHYTGYDMADILKGKFSVKVEKGKSTAYAEGEAAGYARGKAEAKAELLGNMGTPCTGCTAVEVTDGTTTVTLYKPTKVSYIKK